MRVILILFVFTLPFYVISQNDFPFVVQQHETSPPKNEFVFNIDFKEFKNQLQFSPRAGASGAQWTRMQLPLANGVYQEIEVAEAPVFEEKMQNRYADIRSYKFRGINDSHLSGRMSVTPLGVSALFYTKHGNVFIEPIEGNTHKAYNYDGNLQSTFSCGADHSNYKIKTESTSRTDFGATERKYIIAIASTGEFSAKHGNNLTTINSKINDYLNLLNTLYERDLAVTFELTADNDDIIFFDPATDGLNPANNSTKLSSTQSVINSTIGSGNYDIGHAFYEMDPPSGGWWGSGVAGLGVVCSTNSKARGWTGCGGPYPNSFWMGIFAHEVGHQFNATHTFYGTSGNCGGSQRSVGNGVEPGSGNSLMSYEGSCGASGSCSNQNITPQSSFQYFHSHNISQINSFINGSGNCYTSSSTSNSPPVITMPTSKTIPGETPFFLSATATDPDGDPLLMAWEEVDTDNLSLSCPNGDPNNAATSETAPLFRSFDPSESGNLRYFPQMSDILNDTQTKGEILPEVDRFIDMRFIARGTDPNGISGVAYEDVTITVDGDSGPFEVTTASVPTGYSGGQSVNIQWLVNNTNNAPVSCSNVNILFSFDGGNTFPLTLASNVSNDGSHTVTMPGSDTSEGRIKVEAVGNIFFSINKADISISSSCVTNSSTIINDSDVTADAGDPSLDLGLTIGDVVSSVSGTISSADPSTTLIAEDGNGSSCTTVPTTPYYETYKFTASESDTYTFSISGNFAEIMSVYEDDFITPVVNCMNWLSCNAVYTPPNVSISSTTSVTISANDVIELVVSGLFTGETGNYTVNFSSSGTGELIDSDIIPLGFTYKYVIYNSAGMIIAIEDEADLSDATIYSGDIYTVKGLMVSNSANLAPYVNGMFGVLELDVLTGVVCGEFSSNDVTVIVNGCNPGVKTVTSPIDNGAPGTLRYVIENACEGDMIQFDPSLMNSTIILGSEIVITQNMTISGLGQANFALSGNNSNRLFAINSGVTTTFSNMSLINGYSVNNGGAFLNNGNVTLENLRFQGNKNGPVSKAFTNFGSVSIESDVDVLD